MSEPNEAYSPEVHALKVKAVIDGQLEWCRSQGVRVIAPTVDRAAGWAAIEALEDYDFDAVQDGRDEDVRLQLEALAKERESQS